MEKLLKFIDKQFISMSGNVCGEHAITMKDLETLEKLVKTAIKEKPAKDKKEKINLKEAYAYYLSECEQYETYKEKWEWLWPKHFMWSEVCKNRVRWRIELHAIEKALNLSKDEKKI